MQSLLKSTTVALTLSLSAVTLMAVPTLCVQAATPTDKSLRELVEVTQLNETIKQMSSKDSMQKLVNDSMISSVVSDDINNVQRQQLIAVISDYSSSIFDDAYIETINEAQIKAYMNVAKKYFTEAEVDAQINFYNSKEGASIIKKQPIMMQEYADEVRAITTEKVTTEMKKALPIMTKELKSLKLER